LLIDSLLTPIVESTYLSNHTDPCTVEMVWSKIFQDRTTHSPQHSAH